MPNKNYLRDQSLYEHAVMFDPVNQQRYPDGDGSRSSGDFYEVPGCISNPDGSFTITYYAPNAKTCQVRGIGGSMPNTYDMAKSEKMPGYFEVTITDVCAGFHYIEFVVDGNVCMHNQLPIGYGCSFAINFVDATGIDLVYGDYEPGKWYTVNGVQLPARPKQKGVYIYNYRKVVIK